MKSERNILVAFLFNLIFSLLEIGGGILTGSTAILSDALHDLGDAAVIGASFFLEQKSGRPADEICTYGYARHSVLGSLLTASVLLTGSTAALCLAAVRLLFPVEIHHNGMVALAVLGVCVNLGATLLTRGSGSLNQKAVNLHMLEDVLGWAAVLVGALVIKWTGFSLIDPLLSMTVAGFILVNALRTLREALDILLEKTPQGIDVQEIKEHLLSLDGVLDVHHIHLWSMDGYHHCATMHIVTNNPSRKIMDAVRKELLFHGIGHVVLETESEPCGQMFCQPVSESASGCLHHHSHNWHYRSG